MDDNENTPENDSINDFEDETQISNNADDVNENTVQNNNDSDTKDDENKNAISADLIRGHINTIILRTLYDRDKYGYEIIDEIEQKSHGQYSLKQPTLYSALKRLESQGYINAYWKTDEVSLGGRRKYYTLTETGREVTEKNQAEWEYSRTVIDNLISDRSFDFSQPAPTPVDFKILKKSTSRVPVVKEENEEVDNESSEAGINEPINITITNQASYYEAVIKIDESPIVKKTENSESSEKENTVKDDVTELSEAQEAEPEQKIEVKEDSIKSDKNVETDENDADVLEEQRRIAHENYLRLISEPVDTQKTETDVVPVADSIDTDKLIYNNKPETERDYRNLINNLFDKTVKKGQKPQDTRRSEYVAPAASSVRIDDVAVKAKDEGLKVNSSDYVIASRKRNFNLGVTLFKSSLIISVILLLEFTFSLIFKNDMHVSYAYPFVIFAIAVAQLLIFGVLYYAELGKSSRKPTTNTYLTASIIVTVILILIIFIVSILVGVDFTSAGDIFAKLIMPCFVALNIPIFAVCFYVFSKQ